MHRTRLLPCCLVLLLTLMSLSPQGTAVGPAAGLTPTPPADPGCVADALHCHGPVQSDWSCDHHSKRCVGGDDEAVLPAYPMTGWALGPLSLILDRETYELVVELLGMEDKDPNEPPPWEDVDLPIEWERESGHTIGLHGADVHLNTTLRASLLGSNVSLSAQAGASVALGAGSDPPEPNPGQVPCSDPRGCPDLVVDPAKLLRGGIFQQNFPPSHCAVQEGATEPGQRRLLRFTFTSPNVGAGDLVVGDPNDHPQWFEWGECHGHWHFTEYADYRLWTVEGYMRWREARAEDPDARPDELFAADPSLADDFVAGHKQGFCVIDVVRYLPSQSRTYTHCDSDQGISTGWADEYHFGLDGQWIDITDVDPGMYVLEAEVNPERLFQESDYSNNAAAVFVVVPPV